MNKFESSPGEPDNKNVGDVDWSILLEPTDDPTDDEPTDPDALAGSTDDPTDDEPPINPDEWAEGKSDVPNFGANPDLGGDISEENFYDGTEPTIVPNEPSQEAEPVQPTLPENDYSQDRGPWPYHVPDMPLHQERADDNEIPIEEASNIDEESMEEFGL